MKPVYVLNGPNIGRLGTREPAVYGDASYADLVAACEDTAAEAGITVVIRQSDDEATFVGWLHEAVDAAAAVVLNAAAWTHTSVAVRDAAAQLTVPLIEVHLSNPLSREEFRHISYTAGLARGLIAGFGIDSYRLALRALPGLLD